MHEVSAIERYNQILLRTQSDRRRDLTRHLELKQGPPVISLAGDNLHV